MRLAFQALKTEFDKLESLATDRDFDRTDYTGDIQTMKALNILVNSVQIRKIAWKPDSFRFLKPLPHVGMKRAKTVKRPIY